MLLPLFVGFCARYLFVMQYFVSFLKFCNHLAEERERVLIALLQLSSIGHAAVSVLCLFLMMPWVSLQYVIVAFPGHTNLPFDLGCAMLTSWEMLFGLNCC